MTQVMISAEDMRERLTMTRTSLGHTTTTLADLQKSGQLINHPADVPTVPRYRTIARFRLDGKLLPD